MTLDFSHPEVALRLGVSESTIINWENWPLPTIGEDVSEDYRLPRLLPV